MSYASREKKRKYRQAQRAVRTASVKQRSSGRADAWYLTLAKRDGCCNACGGSLRKGAEAVYRHEPREILCVSCSQLREIAPRPSRLWEEARRKRRKNRR